MTVVLDASMALAWIYERAKTNEAKRAQEILDSLDKQTVLVPALWHVEVLNALAVGQRQRRITTAAAMDFLSTLRNLPIDTDAAIPSQREYVLTLALEHHLTAYDAIYLELALRSRAALATFDIRLAEACSNVGVVVA